jgi:inhibitor of KinA
MNAIQLNIYPISESALHIDFGQDISLPLLDILRIFKDEIEKSALPFFQECVVNYNSISIFFSKEYPQFYINYDAAIVQIKNIWRTCKGLKPVFRHDSIFEIPVHYNGLDLVVFESELGICKNEFIALHTAEIYTVAMIGFLPGFPYLIGLNPRLFLPRKSSPRPFVAKGSVAIAGFQTGIYAQDSPGGWQIVGTTAFSLFEIEKSPMPNVLKSGDKVKFVSI